MLASVPSPSSGVVHLGPLSIHAYGIFIALGVVAAVWLSNKRWVSRGGKAEDITTLAMWGVPFGIAGARLYHVITDFQLYESEPWRALYLWDGGLGIWGGIAGGVCAGLVAGRRKGLPLLALLDTVAPALALAQAIGRWGNYFNQELFGRPTDLPWALEISPFNRPDAYLAAPTFHPTFLYESLWNLTLCLTLLWIGKHVTLRPGHLFVIYVAGYTAARFFIEGLRIDAAHIFLGLRINQWVSLTLLIVAVAILITSRVRGPSTEKAFAEKTEV